MKISRAADYAVRAVIYMAQVEDDHPVSAKEIAECEKIPSFFLTKVMQSLSSAGIIQGHRGRTGGLSLIRDAKEITLKDVIEAVDGPIGFARCLVVDRKCVGDTNCAVHPAWEEIYNVVSGALSKYNIADLALEFTEKKMKAAG